VAALNDDDRAGQPGADTIAGTNRSVRRNQPHPTSDLGFILVTAEPTTG
jgi:hypothetical protein